MKNKQIVKILLLPLLLLIAGRAAVAQTGTISQPPIPRFTQSPIVDETNTLSADQLARLDAKLRRYEDSTTNQFAILLISTLGGYPIQDYAVQVFDSNKFGQKGKNNGALIVLALSDHKGFISTGYGLEPTLTDAATTMVYREILVPSLKEGKVYEGLDSATTAMMQIVQGEFKSDQPKSPVRRRGEDPSIGGVFMMVVFFFVILFVLRALFGTGARRTIIGPRGGGSGCLGGILQGLFWSSIFNSGRRGGGWGGGGFGGGGFGGFGGGGGGGWSGGGGMTGGGGAGGDW